MSNTEMKRMVDDSHVESMEMKRDSTLEQDFINYISVPPLERIAFIKVATELCKQSDIRDAIRQHSLEFDPIEVYNIHDIYSIRITSYKTYRTLKKLENRLFMKLLLVQLPNLLKAKVENTFTPVVSQMLQWIRYGRNDTEYMESVCFTIEGTIDKVKTFEQLICKDSAQYHIKSLFELACRYCLEDSIRNLWNKLPKTIQNDYGKIMYRRYNNHLILYWISTVKNDLSGFFEKIKQFDNKNIYNCNNAIYKNMFTLAVNEGNILAVKHFWNKLTNEEKSGNLAQWIKHSLPDRKSFYTIHQNMYDHSNVLFFLLSQMDDSKQQNEVFLEHSKEILLSLFSDWPWQRFLLPTLQTILSSLSGKIYLQKCFIQDITICPYNTDVFCNFLAVGDVSTIKLILRCATVEEKKQIIFSMVSNYKMYRLIYTNKLSLFDRLLCDALSDSDIKNLKEKITLKYGNRLCCDWIYDDNFEMVEMFFNWVFTSQDQIDNFKSEVLDKIEVTYKILKNLGDYEFVDKFLSWCFSTEQDINHFKKKFAKLKHEIVTIGEENWSTFEKFIRWCFTSDEDINDFKCSMLQSTQMSGIIFDSLVYEYNFAFIDKLIGWCCISNEEMKQFKSKFVLCRTWIDILQRFVSNYKVDDSDYNNWELTRKLIKLFFPVEENVSVELKKLISTHIDFDDFREDYRGCSYRIRKKDLFRLIENSNYNIDHNNISSDSDYSCPDDDKEEP